MEASAGLHPQRAVAGRAAIRIALGIVFLGVLIFAPSGTIRFWEGWLFLAVIVACATSVVVWLTLRDPELVDRRLRMKEREREQKQLMVPGWILAVAMFALPGFDHRFDWSDVPAAIVIAANVVLIAMYGLFALILRANRWASRVIEVAPEQTVVSTGPYAVVRHPMYAVAIVLYLCVPIALGSWWGLLPIPLLAVILVLRIRNEESVLRRDLPGYDAYAETVRYRIVPGVW